MEGTGRRGRERGKEGEEEKEKKNDEVVSRVCGLTTVGNLLVRMKASRVLLYLTCMYTYVCPPVCVHVH